MEGYPGSLSWNFSLTSVSAIAVIMKFNADTLAVGQPVSALSLAANFKDRFNVTKISQRLTLVIFNVTAAYDESYGQFNCELLTLSGGWSRKVKVKVIGKRLLLFNLRFVLQKNESEARIITADQLRNFRSKLQGC